MSCSTRRSASSSPSFSKTRRHQEKHQQQPSSFRPNTCCCPTEFVDGDVAASATAPRSGRSRPNQQAQRRLRSRNVYVFNAFAPSTRTTSCCPTPPWAARLNPATAARLRQRHPSLVDGLSLGPAITMADRTTVRA
jgi:hypothetical protein